MDAAVSTLDTKLIQLQFARERTEETIQSKRCDKIERQIKALKELSGEADQLKRTLEGMKIAAKESAEEVKQWNDQIEEKITRADDDILRLKEWLEKTKREENQKIREEELDYERKLFETRLKFQTELNAVKSNKGEGSESAKDSSGSTTGLEAKLPKLVITKFNGTFQDWPRFWGQFCEAIDKSSIASVTKFSYLRELLAPKPRMSIEALPFSAEGYNRAVAILKDKYGKESEIVKAYNKEILELPVISGVDLKAIHQFHERLAYCVQSLQTMGKLDQVNGNVPMTLDKLPGIRGDLVRTDDSWESWDFVKLCEALRLWIRRNPVDSIATEEVDPKYSRRRRERSDKLFAAKQGDLKHRKCVYCEDTSHVSRECPKISTLDERKRFLAQRHLCFNCTSSGHQASNCRNKYSCRNCGRRHHTSICDRMEPPQEVALTAAKRGDGIFPVVNVKVNGIECRALIDTGAGSSYASAKLIDLLKIKPIDVKVKQVDMLLGTSVSRLETYKSCVESVYGDFKMDVNLVKVNKGELLTLDNPSYDSVIAKYPHLKGVKLRDRDTKPRLPVHIILGAGEYARVKTETPPHIGRDGEPVAELTKLGWFVMSPGQEFDRNAMMLTQTSQLDYEELCRLDVLGLADSPPYDQQAVYSEFKEQLVRSEQGWYETGLPWKGDRATLPNNENGSLQRLRALTRKLQRAEQTTEYDSIIREQKEQGIIESADQPAQGVEFYIPHKPVVRENAESTKMRIVYDASARAHPSAPSLNDCLNAGPPLQNKLWDVLVRQRCYPVAVTGDLKKAFLQVRIRELDRDALRFHWRQNEHSALETLRFTRALFGLTCSPFLLGGVLESHLQAWESKMPELVAELRKNLYVDDLLSGGVTVQQAQYRKEQAIEIFDDAGFTLHKWHSNVPIMEGETDKKDTDLSFAKQQLQQSGESKASLLGLGWDKEKDELKVKFLTEEVQPTKRGVLSKLAKVYDPLGLVSPVTLEGKVIFRDVCDEKQAWDAKLAGPLLRRWQKWEQSLPTEVSVPRSITSFQEPLQDVELHGFGDGSKLGVGAAVYAVVRQASGKTQRLVAAKARLAKGGLSIPRLELVAGHMATNLLTNVRNALEGLPISNVYGWLDSTVALHWIRGSGEFKQFVQNRVTKIRAQSDMVWRHVSSEENPADLASRGGAVNGPTLWWNGPKWLANREEWPPNPVTSACPATEVEVKTIREVLSLAQPNLSNDRVEEVLEKHELKYALRVAAWVTRFITNCKTPKKLTGPLTADELENVKWGWIKRVQRQATTMPNYPQIKSSLNLQPNKDGLLECRGHIQGKYPIYLPEDATFTRKLVRRVHCETLHGGVGLTMAAIREMFWVPRLRRLVKKVTKDCWGCKRFQVTAVAAPPPGPLPTNRTEGTTAFEVAGVDFAGPIRYRKGSNREGKAYIALFACSLTRGVHLELLPSLETGKFLPCLKRFIARRGRPKTLYSDNGGTFVKASKWLKGVQRDEEIQGLLEQQEIRWHFNLPRAPWWGGQFERLIGVVKRAFNKTIGATTLTWDELNDVILDVEVQINRRPLSYVDDDVQLPILTPSAFLFQRSNMLPEQEPWREKDVDLRRREKYLRSCKDQLWRRWTREYLTALRERHNLNHKCKRFEVA